MSNNSQINIDGFIIDLNSQFGHGSFSLCYKCQNPKYNQPLCVKVIQKTHQTFTMFEREIEIIQKLFSVDCEYLVKVLHISKQENKCYIFMEYCSQGDLEKFIAKRRNIRSQLTIQEILSILEQLIQGYKILYECRIIHRDIKPANIFIGNNGCFQLADYGVSKILDDPSQVQKQSQIGTPSYAAPQVLIGDFYSNKCDVYSLGVVVYELIYQNVPIQSRTTHDLIQSLLRTRDKKIQIQDFPQNLFGSVQDKQKLIQFLSQSLVYEESSRISWEEIFKMFPNIHSSMLLKRESNQISQQQIPIQESNQAVSTIQFDQDIKQLENNQQQYKETEVLRSYTTLLSTIQNSNNFTNRNSIQSNNQTFKLISEQVQEDIPPNQIPQLVQTNLQKKAPKILIKTIDNIIENIIEFYLAKLSYAERLFIKNQKFLEFMDKNNNHLVNYRPQISCLQQFQILLSGYQSSNIFNIYHLVSQRSNYWDELQITQELKEMTKQFLQQQVNFFRNGQTEKLIIQQKYIKQLYILQKLAFRKQLKIVQDYQQKYNINFKLEEIIGDTTSDQIFYSPKLFYNQYKIKFNDLNLNFYFENENESLIEHMKCHLAFSIIFFTMEEQYNDLGEIVNFDYKQSIKLPDDKQSMDQIIQNYISNLIKNKY